MSLPKCASFRGRSVPYSEAKVGLLTDTLNYGTGGCEGMRGRWNEDEERLFTFLKIISAGSAIG
jgi:branched-chain amino acid aminotransferase